MTQIVRIFADHKEIRGLRPNCERADFASLLRRSKATKAG
jgi:hypothetical protein